MPKNLITPLVSRKRTTITIKSPHACRLVSVSRPMHSIACPYTPQSISRRRPEFRSGDVATYGFRHYGITYGGGLEFNSNGSQ